MQIEIDSLSGFCYGVTNSISLAETHLKEGQKVFCLGEIVHNQEEVARLKSMGLEVISNDDLSKLQNARVLIRAHGEPPATFQQLSDAQNTVFDGTCPIVLHLQKKVRKAYADMQKVNGQVVIYGKKGHAEVIGLAGQADNKAIVIASQDELSSIDFTRPVALFSQTTQSPHGYKTIADTIRKELIGHGLNAEASFTVTDSICKHVSKRGEHLAEFASQHNVIIFVSGTNSSNGKVLFQICQQNNQRAHWVSSPNDLKAEWFKNASTVGICGATSTPFWLMKNVKEGIEKFNTFD
jgi:4-hydroxy-3-methylbut-2-enyl diphosphate reductase